MAGMRKSSRKSWKDTNDQGTRENINDQKNGCGASHGDLVNKSKSGSSSAKKRSANKERDSLSTKKRSKEQPENNSDTEEGEIPESESREMNKSMKGKRERRAGPKMSANISQKTRGTGK